MNDRMTCRDIWLRHTSTDGKSHVQCHRVWDAERFVASQQQAAQNLNDKVEGDGPRKASVQQITEEQFNKERA